MQTFKTKLQNVTKATASTWKKDRQFEAKLNGQDAEKHKVFAQHQAAAEGLLAFSQEFVLSLDGMIALVNRLLEVFRAVDPAWLSDVAHRECKAQVWSLTMGIKATAPRVSKELKRHLKGLERVAEGAKTAQAILERKARAQQERNHYLLKLQGLREEAAERQRDGKASSSEQVQRMARNEEKLAKAQQQLDDCNEEVEKQLEQQLKNNKAVLASALHSTAQVTTCGWFVSTGAVICRSLYNAERAGAEGTSDASDDDTSPASTGEKEKRKAQEPVTQQPQGMLALPPILKEDSFEPPGRFDPADPLAPDNTGPLPEPSGIAEHFDRTAAASENSAGEERPLEDFSVRELRERLRANGLSDAGCVEKSELVQRLRSGSTVSLSVPSTPTVSISSPSNWPPNGERSTTTPIVGQGGSASSTKPQAKPQAATSSSSYPKPAQPAKPSQATIPAPASHATMPATASPRPATVARSVSNKDLPRLPKPKDDGRRRNPKPQPPRMNSENIGDAFAEVPTGSWPPVASASNSPSPSPSPQKSPSGDQNSPSAQAPQKTTINAGSIGQPSSTPAGTILSPQSSWPPAAQQPASSPWPAPATAPPSAPSATFANGVGGVAVGTPMAPAGVGPAAAWPASPAPSPASVTATPPLPSAASWPGQMPWPSAAGPAPRGCAASPAGTWPRPQEGSRWPLSPDSQVATPSSTNLVDYPAPEASSIGRMTERVPSGDWPSAAVLSATPTSGDWPGVPPSRPSSGEWPSSAALAANAANAAAAAVHARPGSAQPGEWPK